MFSEANPHTGAQPGTGSRVIDIDQQRRQLDRWLISIPVCQTKGADLGAVAGRVDEAGLPRYFYGEIAGYFLSWAAWRSACDDTLDKTLVPLVVQVLSWLRTGWDGIAIPVTRQNSDQQDDWRNDFLFSFDLAMILRGVADARSRFGNEIVDWDAGPVVDNLQKLRTGGCVLQAALSLKDHPLPKRWSTQPGGFQTKTAAAIAKYAELFAAPDLADLARDLWLSCMPDPDQLSVLPPHPRLYALEGLHNMQPRSAATKKIIRRELGRLGRHLVAINNGPRDQPEYLRQDVLAQWLRLATIYPLEPELPLEIISQTLGSFKPQRGLPLTRNTDDTDGRTWLAIFWSQALAAMEDSGRIAGALI